MDKTYTVKQVLESKDLIGKDVTVRAWIKSSRKSGKIGFIALNDGSSFKPLQAVITSDLENFDEISKLSLYTSVKVTGTVVESQKEGQDVELLVSNLEVEFESNNDYPLQQKRHTFEYLRQIAHLRPRANTFQAVFKIRSLAAFAIHEFFQKRGFIYVNTPIITASDCEGAGEMFRVTTLEQGAKEDEKDFFGKDAYLSVSGQLNGEAFATAFGKIYTFGPTFRAENSNTTKHAAEFWMIEPEVAFCDLDGIMDLAEDMFKHIVEYVMEHAKDELEFLDQYVQEGLIAKLEDAISHKFARVTYTQAIEDLLNCGHEFETPVYWGIDLETEHERYLAEQIYKKPLFLTDYPKGIKAFYMRNNDDGKTVAATDLLVPAIGELIGGSQREDREQVLIEKMEENGLDTEGYRWYTELRKYGSVEHAGFGLGFERLIMYLTGMQNIRDVIPFPRTPRNCEF